MADEQPSEMTTAQLLETVINAHRKASEAIKTEALDESRIRSDLSLLHHGVATLAWVANEREKADTPSTELQNERRLEFSKIRIAHLYEETRESSRAVIDFALVGLRGIFLVNAGALIGILTFIGNFRALPSATTDLWLAFGIFVGGVFFSLVAVVMAYFAQGETYLGSESDAESIFFHEYRDHAQVAKEKTEASIKHKGAATVCRLFAIGAAVVAVLAFGVGSGFGLAALMSTKSAQETVAEPKVPAPAPTTVPAPK